MQRTVSMLVLAAAATLAAPAPAATAPLHYTVRAAEPASHFMEVELEVAAEYGCPDLAFSVWTPGGYSLHPHAADVLDLRATSPAGASLPAAKTDLNTWHVACGSEGGYTVRFRVHALAPRTPYSAHVDDRLLFANAVTVLPYLPAHQDAPATLEIDPPAGWHTVCSLPRQGDGPWTAPSWDALADAVLAAAPDLRTRSFTVGHTTFTVAFSSRPASDLDMDAVVDAHRKLAEAAAHTFGGLPFDRYLFFYKVGPEGSHGGLEHSFSTAMGISRSAVATTKSFRKALGLPAHEFVHAWNVKRARPQQLRPYDYAHSQPTDLLWVAEGWTSYYGPLLLARAGLRTHAQLYATLSDRLRYHRSNPGNRFRSLVDFSRDSWLDSSIPFVSFRSYYVKGSLSGLDLDLRLREASGGRHTLDELMRTLLTDPRLVRRGYTIADLRSLASRLAGRSMDPWFDRIVERPGYMNLQQSLATVGLRLVPDAARATAGFTGLRLQDAKDQRGAEIRWTEPDSPAAAAGLGEGDLLLAVDGLTGNRTMLESTLRKLKPGHTATLTIVRGDRVLELRLTPAPMDPMRVPVIVEETPNATPAQAAARKAWLWE
ncbi:MAG: M61 family metallopeptidase [Acidobacteria bacterium]|nr:M61 family metallopeptidase [Acidobacteriota bacterium]